MKYKIVFLLFLYSVVSSAQKSRFSENETLYVWALNGLNMRKLPDAKSEKIAALPYGEKVIVQSNIGIIVAHEVEEFKNFKVKGVWLLVKYGDKEGFVFDGYLSRLVAPEKAKQNEAGTLIESYFYKQIGEKGDYYYHNIRGKQIKFKKEDEQKIYIDWEKGEFLSKLFNYDITYEYRGYEKYSYSAFIIPNASLYEGYVLLKKSFPQEKIIIDKKGLLFWHDGGNRYQIYLDKGSNLIVEWYFSC